MAPLPDVNAAEIEAIAAIAKGAGEGPVLMLNLNAYRSEAGYPDGEVYTSYMAALDTLLDQVGARILWRAVARGQVGGDRPIDEAIGIWYPTHQAFLDLATAPGSAENMRLRRLAVERADLHRCRAG